MAYIQYLQFDGKNLPLPDSYDYSSDPVEADTTGETEAGTRQRDVVRDSVVTISVSFSVSAKWLKYLSGYAKKSKFSVNYFDTEELMLQTTEMFISGYKAVLVKDTSRKGLWTVSFTLNEF